MILTYQYSSLVGFLLFCSCVKGHAQELPVVEASKEKQETYRIILRRNKAVVTFIENTLAQNGLPKILRNLALIESGFDRGVVSSANAGGIWQFTIGHANDYGLKSDGRFDIYRSTQIAVKSLMDLYGKYGNWVTVIAAYNCGEGNIKKAMDKANSDRYDRFYTYLPSETINHVHKFMEVCAVTGELDFLMTDYKLSGFKPTIQIKAQTDMPNNPALASTEINAAYSLDVIAAEMGMEQSEIDKWNPDIEKELINKGAAMLYMPVDRMPDFLLLKNHILNRSLQTAAYHD